MLNTVENGRKLVEWPFCLSSAPLSAGEMNRLAKRFGYAVPQLVFDDMTAYLNGFVDLVFEVVDKTLGHCAVACEIRAHIECFGLREFPARTEASGSVKDMSAVRRILNISGAGRGIAVHSLPARRLSSLGERRNAEHMTAELAAERKERGHSDIEEPELSLVKETKLVARQFVAKRTAARCDRG